jgi:hypothetical protein
MIYLRFAVTSREINMYFPLFYHAILRILACQNRLMCGPRRGKVVRSAACAAAKTKVPRRACNTRGMANPKKED